MKKFLLHVLKIILPILVFLLVLEITIRKIPNDYQVKHTYLKTKASQINTLILGSSHTYYGINPIYLEKKSFNAAYVSQTLDLDYEILIKYHNQTKNLKTIVIPISYFSLFETLETDFEKWRIKNYFLYYKMPLKTNIQNKFEILNSSILSNLKMVIKHYITNKSYITTSKLGWGTNFTNSSNTILNGKYTAKKHTVKNFNLMASNLKSIQKIIKFCKKRNIKIIFLSTPTHPTYFRNLNNKQLLKTQNTILSIVKNNENCSYLNLLKSNKFKATDFHDADHLNPMGAKKLTFMLKNYLH